MQIYRIIFTCFALSISVWYSFAQTSDFAEQYETFKNSVKEKYENFRILCNKKYADFIRTAWEEFKAETPVDIPKERNVLPPMTYEEPLKNADSDSSLNSDDIYNPEFPAILPVLITPPELKPQPLPIEPVREVLVSEENYHTFNFYGLTPRVRLPQTNDINLTSTDADNIAHIWETLSGKEFNNTIRDCLECRIRFKLCDWAYLQFLWNLASSYTHDENSATLLTAFLFCQSGYKTRLAKDGDKLMMLYASDHLIYKVPYFIKDNVRYYPFRHRPQSIQFCGAFFEGEKPLSLVIQNEQYLGDDMSEIRTIISKRFNNLTGRSTVPLKLIEFYNSYPTANIDDNPLSRWAMYANTPLSSATKKELYPDLISAIEGLSKLEATEKLLNWVQTGLVYEYDDKVWGDDRAFFAEETLYYPYCDCEDRSILFSRLVRELLDLDVALISYPDHLATAVNFNSEVAGAYLMISGKKFIICDPTYIGAPVGKQMPGLDYSSIEAILLNR